MRRSGLQLLLSSMGIEIDPQDVMKKYEEAKNIMPKLAEFVNNLDARLKVIEETQTFLVKQVEELCRLQQKN